MSAGAWESCDHQKLAVINTLVLLLSSLLHPFSPASQKKAVPPTAGSSHLSQCNQDSPPRGPSPMWLLVLSSSVDTWVDSWACLGDGLQPRTKLKSDYHWILLKYSRCSVMMSRDVFTASRATALQKCPCELRTPPPWEMWLLNHQPHGIPISTSSAFYVWRGRRMSVQDENTMVQWRLSSNDSLWNRLFPVPTVIWVNCLIILFKCHYFCKHQSIRPAFSGLKNPFASSNILCLFFPLSLPERHSNGTNRIFSKGCWADQGVCVLQSEWCSPCPWNSTCDWKDLRLCLLKASVCAVHMELWSAPPSPSKRHAALDSERLHEKSKQTWKPTVA